MQSVQWIEMERSIDFVASGVQLQRSNWFDARSQNMLIISFCLEVWGGLHPYSN
jgi:hypothetical protein